MALRLLPLASLEARRDPFLSFFTPPPPCSPTSRPLILFPAKLLLPPLRHRRTRQTLVSVGREEATELQVSDGEGQERQQQQNATSEDLEYVSLIKTVLEVLKKNRDMLFGEVKLTMMIEDPRELERKRLLGIDLDEVTRDDLVSALEDVHAGRIPENRVALRLLAEEMAQWPNLEVEATKKRPGKSLYARATDVGIDPQEAVMRLNIDWDSAADIEPGDESDDVPVPPVVV